MSDAEETEHRHAGDLQQYDAVLLCSLGQDGRPYGDARVTKFVGADAWLYGRNDPADWRTKGVHDERNWTQARRFLAQTDQIGVQNSGQAAVLRECQKPLQVMPYCVDKRLFFPRDRTDRRELTIGWCGQLTGGPFNTKGHGEVFRPLQRRLGPRFCWSAHTADARTALSAQEMCRWYCGLDVFLCTSCSEGGPQPPFEAAACGCVVASTDVGQVADWHDLRRLSLVVPNYRNPTEAARTVDAMAKLLAALDADRAKLAALRAELLASIGRHYDAEKEYPKHIDFILGGDDVRDT